VSYSYTAGRLTMVTKPDGRTIQYAYSASGLLTSITNERGIVVTASNYETGPDISGRVMSQTRAAGDPAGNLLTAALGGTSVSYGYDVLNRVTSMNRGNGVNTTFAYDPAGRLKSIAHGSVGTDVFEYDAAGQRVKRTMPFAQPLTTTAASYNVDDANRISTHTHDFNGNRSGDGVNTYVWDSRKPFLTARGIDSHLAAIAAGSPMYALTDAINSTSATTDASGAVQTRYFYEPYGQTISTGPGSYLFQYTGRVPVTGNIYHYRATFYQDLGLPFSRLPTLNSVRGPFTFPVVRYTASVAKFVSRTIPIISAGILAYDAASIAYCTYVTSASTRERVSHEQPSAAKWL
jgi:YD repeat-containing protein